MNQSVTLDVHSFMLTNLLTTKLESAKLTLSNTEVATQLKSSVRPILQTSIIKSR